MAALLAIDEEEGGCELASGVPEVGGIGKSLLEGVVTLGASIGAAIRQEDDELRGARIALSTTAEQPGGGLEGAGEWGFAASGQGADALLGEIDAVGGREDELSVRIPEDGEADTIAATVSIEEESKDDAFGEGDTAAGSHGTTGIDNEMDEGTTAGVGFDATDVGDLKNEVGSARLKAMTNGLAGRSGT